MLSFTMTPKSINLCINNKIFTVDETHVNYTAIKDHLRTWSNNRSFATKKKYEGLILELCDIKKFISRWTRGDVQVGEDLVLYKGNPVSGVISERLVGMVSDGFSPEPLAAFLAKVQDNPITSARDELYLWLETSKLPICEDGDFLAYKRVNDDYTSIHDNKTDNSIGARPVEPRDLCDTDRTNTCSRGLHFCSYDYLAYFGGARTVIVKVNPADVVAIPEDYSNQKGRAWTYKVVDEVTDDRIRKFEDLSVAKVDSLTGVGASDKYTYVDMQSFDEADNSEVQPDFDDEDDNCDCHDCTVDPGVSDNDDENVQIFSDDAPVAERYDCRPPHFIDTWARSFVDGDNSALFLAFSWALTEQGYEFWYDVSHGNASDVDTARARNIVRYWLGDLVEQPTIEQQPARAEIEYKHGDQRADEFFTSKRDSSRYGTQKFGRGVRLTKGDRSITLSELKAMLKEHGQRGTARLTGIPRTTIQEWIARYNLA